MRSSFWLRTGALLLAMWLAGASHAATRTWAGGFGPDWSTAGNWGASGLPLAGDTVVFPNPVTSNANLAGNPALAAIVLGPSSGGSVINGAVTINGFAATFNIDDENTTATANTINAAITITGTTLYVRSQNAAHTLNSSGVISGGFGVRVFGPGSVDFSGPDDNTYTGSTTVVSAGTLLLSGAGFKLVPGDLFIGDGTGAANSARVKLTSAFSDLIVDTSKVTIASDGQLDMGIRSDTIAQLSGTGNVTMSGSNILTVGDTGNFTFGGVISGSGNVNKVGTGSLTYTAANTYTGLTTVSRGTLLLGTPLNVQAIANASPITVGTGSGTSLLATLRQTNQFQVGGGITVASDGLVDMGNFFGQVSSLNVNGGSVIGVSGGCGTSFGLIIGGVLLMTGGSISGGSIGASAVLATSSAIAGAVINSGIQSHGDNTFTVNSGVHQPELTIAGNICSDTANRSIIKTGTGTLRLAGGDANSYGGSTTIQQGVLELAKPDNVAAITGPIVIGNGTDAPGSATLRNLASNQLTGKPEVTLNLSGVYQVSNSSVGVRTETIGKLRGSGKLFLPFRPELTIDFDSGFPAFFGPIDSPSPNGDGNKRINKRGGGEQIFNFDTTYDGTLVVYAGNLYVEGQMPNAPVSIQGGLVGGSGRVADVDVGSNVAATPSTLAPGGGFGNVLTTGAAAFSFGPSARLQIDLASATPGTHGNLTVTGAFRPGDNGGGSLYVNPIGNPVPANGTVFEIVTKTSVGAVTGTFPGLPQGRSVYMGARNGKISYVGGDGNDTTLTVAPTLDIDGDSKYLAETDGLLIARHIKGLIGPALTQGAVAISGGARRTSDSDILNYLNGLGNLLNVDQVGTVNNDDALLILRWMFGYRDEALVAGLPLPPGSSAVQFADTVRNLMEQLTP